MAEADTGVTGVTDVTDQIIDEGQPGQQTTVITQEGDKGTLITDPGKVSVTSDTAWKSQLDEEFRTHPSLASINTMNDMAKSYVHAQSMVGKDKVVKIGADADMAAKQNFFKELGWGQRPDTKDDYALNTQDAHADFQGNLDNTVAFMREKFHEHGLTKTQAEGIFNDFIANQSSSYEQSTKDIAMQEEQAVNDLRQEFGQSFDHKIGLAKQTLDQIDPSGEIKSILNETRLGNNPHILKMFIAIGEKVLGDNIVPGQANRQFVVSPDQAKGEIETLKGDKEFQAALFDRGNPGHELARKKWTELHQIGHPGERT